jgi:hypothetical protein
MVLVAAGPALWPIAIPAITAVLGGAIGAGISAYSTGKANQNARLLAREAHEREIANRRQERLDERRADVYCQLLVRIGRQAEAMKRIYPLITVAGYEPQPVTEPDLENELVLEAQVAAFGSQAVDDLRAEWREAWQKFFALAMTVQFMEQQNKEGPRVEVDQQRRDALPIVQRVEAQIRKELQEAPTASSGRQP